MERWIKKYQQMDNFTIEPWDSRYYALFDGDELVCVTAYKKGAIEVMKRLTKVRMDPGYEDTLRKMSG